MNETKNVNWQNNLYTGDNLYILHGMNSESVDLIYLDPPFNSKRTYSAPIESKAAGVSFKDMWTWEDVDEAYLERLTESHPYLVRYLESISGLHSKAMMAYITYMTERILECHRILKDTGSLYLHCDPTASHYLKNLLDFIFGKKNFCNEIIWCYSTGGKSKRHFGRKHDVILFYSKNNENYYFNDEDIRIEMKSGKTSFGGKLETDEEGRDYRLVYGTKNSNDETRYYKYYLDEGKIPEDWWSDINSLQSKAKERTGYPTQKPLALLDRIIQASCPEGGIVLDPFCGCATTCVSAQLLLKKRRWIGIDIEKKAAELLIDRLTDAQGILFKDFIRRTDIPKRTDIEIILPTIDIKHKLFKQQNTCCNGCLVKLDIQHFEIDHVVPKSKGGGDYYENYQLLCANCNRIKGNRPMEYLRIKIRAREELIKDKITFGS